MADDKQYTIDEFAESLLTAKNYTTLTAEMRVELKNDIVERVHDYLIAKTIAKLSDEDVKKLNALLDKDPSDEEIQKFITTTIADAPTFIGDTLFQFRQTYLGIN
jgi:hypothetical protein